MCGTTGPYAERIVHRTQHHQVHGYPRSSPNVVDPLSTRK